jgi:hypothetical protein
MQGGITTISQVKGLNMKIPTDTTQKEQLLNQLRVAVASQIKLWDACSYISEAIDCDLDRVMNNVNAMAITADDGSELGRDDLDDLLGLGVPGRIVVGKPLDDRDGQIH